MPKNPTKPCPTCGKPFHWRRKRALEGKTSNKLGRPMKYNYDEIKKTRELHPDWSLREIAHFHKASLAGVQRALKY